MMKMKAIVYENYGPPDVLQLKEIEKPTPKDTEVLVKVHATTVTIGDTIMRSFNLPPIPGWQKFMARLILGWRKPKRPILGMELAGEVESVGRNVTRFKPGDPVFASTFAVNFGGYVEYKCLPENGVLALKPANLTYEEAAAIPGAGQTAWQCLKKGKIQPGQKVLIYGASGAVGTYAVQLASHHFGADVTGVCSTANVELVRSLGATHVVDYTKEDFTRNGETYDVIVDTAGTAPFSRSKASLKEGGRLLMVLGGLPDMLQIPWVSMTSNKKVIAGPAAERADDLRFLAELAQAGEFKPVIDRRYPFEQIAEAHSYVDTGHKKGNVIITLERDD